MKQSDYLFVINPISGNYSKQALYDFIEEEDKRSTFFYEIYETTGNNDSDALSELLTQNEFQTVVVAGGDGTLLLVASLMVESTVPIGIIPLGSANGMARELGIPKDFERLRSLILSERIRIAWSIIKKRNIRALDILKINQRYYSLHLSDIGLNAEIVKRFESEKIRGYKGYARQFLKEFRQKQEIRYRIWTDDVKHKGSAYMICIANAKMYGTGAVINPDGRLDDGLFEISVVKNITVAGLLKALLSIFSSNVQYQEKDLKVYSCRKAVIKLKRKKTLQVDGEIVGKFDRLEAEIIPGAVRIIT